MAQQLTYTAPEVVTRNGVSIEHIHMDRRGGGELVVGLIGSDGVSVTKTVSGPRALAIISAISTANLSIKSLDQRLLERFATDGDLPAGTVTGTPS